MIVFHLRHRQKYSPEKPVASPTSAALSQPRITYRSTNHQSATDYTFKSGICLISLNLFSPPIFPSFRKPEIVTLPVHISTELNLVKTATIKSALMERIFNRVPKQNPTRQNRQNQQTPCPRSQIHPCKNTRRPTRLDPTSPLRQSPRH